MRKEYNLFQGLYDTKPTKESQLGCFKITFNENEST